MKNIKKVFYGIAVSLMTGLMLAACDAPIENSSKKDNSVESEAIFETVSEQTTTTIIETNMTETKINAIETETIENNTEEISTTFVEISSEESSSEETSTEIIIINDIASPLSEEHVLLSEENVTFETTFFNNEITTSTIENEGDFIKNEFFIRKTVEEIAVEVWKGLWENGETRKQRLEEAGYNYKEVQKKVNELRDVCYVPQKEVIISNENETFVKNFSRGTFYCYGSSQKGGSGRALIECNTTSDIKGSIASSYLYKNYGYNYNGKRTTVRLEVYGYPEMNGYYYLDDSDAGNPNVIDFYYLYATNCPFNIQGVVSVDCWIVN